MEEALNGLEVEVGYCVDGEEAPSYLEIELRNFETLLVPLKDILEMRMDEIVESRLIELGSNFMEKRKLCRSLFLKLDKRREDIYERLSLNPNVDDIAYLTADKFLKERVYVPWESGVKGKNACCKISKDEEGSIILSIERR